MKLAFSIIFATSLWHSGFSQKFLETSKYKVTVDEYILDSIGQVQSLNGDTTYIRLLDSFTEAEIFRIPLYSEFFDGYDLKISFDQKTVGLDHIIKFTTVYLACCSDETIYYFLVTKDNKIISLPDYTETFCDGPEPYKEYTFDKNLIRLTHFYPNQENEIDSTKTILTYRLENGKLKEEK